MIDKLTHRHATVNDEVEICAPLALGLGPPRRVRQVVDVPLADAVTRAVLHDLESQLLQRHLVVPPRHALHGVHFPAAQLGLTHVRDEVAQVREGPSHLRQRLQSQTAGR